MSRDSGDRAQRGEQRDGSLHRRPAGYEFATLIEDLVDVSRGTTGSASQRETLSLSHRAGTHQGIRNTYLTTLPGAARMAHMMASKVIS